MLLELKLILSRTSLMLSLINLLKKANNRVEESTLLPMLFRETANPIMKELTNLTRTLIHSKANSSQDKMNLIELKLRTTFKLKNRDELLRNFLIN